MIIERTIEYRWEGRALSIGMASAGNGPDVRGPYAHLRSRPARPQCPASTNMPK